MAEVQSRMSVATSERDLLLKQQQDAKGEIGCPGVHVSPAVRQSHGTCMQLPRGKTCCHYCWP